MLKIITNLFCLLYLNIAFAGNHPQQINDVYCRFFPNYGASDYYELQFIHSEDYLLEIQNDENYCVGDEHMSCTKFKFRLEPESGSILIGEGRIGVLEFIESKDEIYNLMEEIGNYHFEDLVKKKNITQGYYIENFGIYNDRGFCSVNGRYSRLGE